MRDDRQEIGQRRPTTASNQRKSKKSKQTPTMMLRVAKHYTPKLSPLPKYRVMVIKVLLVYLYVGSNTLAFSFSSSNRRITTANSQRRPATALLDSTNDNGIVSPIKSIQNSIGVDFEKAKSEGFGTRARNAAINATVGDILVPLCSDLEQRQALANRGIYAGVEYRICLLQILDNDEETTISCQTLQGTDIDQKRSAIAMIQPRYPLRPHLERNDWPVPVRLLEEVPLWLSKATYDAGTAVGALFLSSSILVLAAIVAFFIQFVGVPTASMVPALQPGNIVLMTRSVPLFNKPKVGDVVFFDAPPQLELAVQQFVSSSSSSSLSSPKGKQFLKRVAALPGESVGVRRSEPYVLKGQTFRFDIVGPYAQPELFPAGSWERPPKPLSRNEYFVAGDNGYRSVDSRVWGPLQDSYIIGTAQWIVWPPQDFGPIPPGQISEITPKTPSTVNQQTSLND